jgi:phenylpyruvate tautomerase PptA (4-oxalocrotonate tautomerase family)
MPLVTITLRPGRTPEQKLALMQAVHTSLVEAFKIPAWDFNQRILELRPEDFHIPANKSALYTIVEMTVFPGRSLAAKRQLYQSVAARLEALGIPKDDVVLVLHEPPLDNWGIRGGIPASEADVGFKLDV